MGYNSERYLQSLSQFGEAIHLRKSEGWLIKRVIPGTDFTDAIGPYPLFVCGNWQNLQDDLEELGTSLVSVAVVTDPFGDYNDELLRKTFPDVVKPFKQHVIIDLRSTPHARVSDHHKRNARKAMSALAIERSQHPEEVVNDWIELYQYLIERHGISGMATFSASAFRIQFQMTDLVPFVASDGQGIVGMVLFLCSDDVIYYHLGAYNERGYELKASYALFWRALEHFAALGYRCLSLGAGAGLAEDSTDGLARFKRGWSSETRTAYFCGRVTNRMVYHQLVNMNDPVGASFFPAYRFRASND